jgi:hypothetical protein
VRPVLFENRLNCCEVREVDHDDDEDNDDDDDDDTQTRALSSFTNFSLHIRSLSFSVSVHTLQSPIYTSSSPSPVPSCYTLVAGCPVLADVFSHCGKVKMFVRSVRNVVYDLEDLQTFGVPNPNLPFTGTEPFKTRKTGTVP